MLINFNKKPLIVAEIGMSHLGDFNKAINFINRCKDTGADIVKFQTHSAENESTFDEPFRVKISNKYKNRFEYWKKTEFNKFQWKKIINHCKKKKIIFQTSPFSIESFRMMSSLGCVNWKIGSGEALSLELLKEICNTKANHSLTLSTGLLTLNEIKKIYKILKKSKIHFSILQCTTKYPVKFKEVGLNVISQMQKIFDCPIGLSDHSGSLSTSLLALSKNAKIIEVHVSGINNKYNPDFSSSLNFTDLSRLVKFRNDMLILNKFKVNKNVLLREQKKNKIIFSKSIALKKNIKKGTKILISMIKLKKPGFGLSVNAIKNIIGKKAKKDLSRHKLLKRSDYE